MPLTTSNKPAGAAGGADLAAQITAAVMGISWTRAGRDPAQAFLRETIARRDAERQAPSDNPLTETKEGSEHV